MLYQVVGKCSACVIFTNSPFSRFGTKKSCIPVTISAATAAACTTLAVLLFHLYKTTEETNFYAQTLFFVFAVCSRAQAIYSIRACIYIAYSCVLCCKRASLLSY